MAKLDRELSQLLRRLPVSQQQRLLEFARGLSDVKLSGVPGVDLIVFGGRIPPDDLQQMQNAIEEGCETVNQGEW